MPTAKEIFEMVESRATPLVAALLARVDVGAKKLGQDFPELALWATQASEWAEARKPEAAAAGLLTTLIIAITLARALPMLLSGLTKLSMMFWGTIGFFLSRDKSWRRPADCEFQ